MSKVSKTVSKAAATLLALGLMSSPLAVTAQTTTQNLPASKAFPGLQAFLTMPESQRSQVGVYYILRIKHCDASQVRVALNAGGRTIPLGIGGDGRISPTPSAAQLNGTVTISGPASCVVAPKIRVYSTQGLKQDYDAVGLATGVKQGNSAMTKIAGVLAFGLPKLDRVYFVGGGNGTVTLGNGQTRALPKSGAGEYPAGTPYFVPAQTAGAAKIHLSSVPHAVMFDTPEK